MTREFSDCVFIDDLEEASRIGTTEAERAFPQVVSISVRIFLDLDDAGRNDDLTTSVDYAAAAADIRNLLKNNEFKLAEGLATEIATLILRRDRVVAAWVRVEKRVLPGIRAVGAEIFRVKHR